VRFMIDPYLPYRRIEDLYPYDRCARKKSGAAAYYDCFVYSKLGLRSGEEQQPAARSPSRKGSNRRH
jgi:hypothetical protein